MNLKFNLEAQTLRELYKRYKNYLIPGMTIAVCFVLLIQVTIPQISYLSQKQQEQTAEKAKLNTLNQNFDILSRLTNSALDFQLQLVTDALPPEKNFAGIINSVNLSADKAGVFLGDYEFVVGDLSKVPPGKNAPRLELVLSVNGGVGPTTKFIEELYKSLPIAEVTSIVVGGTHSTVTAVFYYKSFVDVSDSASPLSSLTQDQIDLIRQLSKFNDPRILESFSFISTSSAVSTSPF